MGRLTAPYLLILPSLLFAFWIIGYPIFDMAGMSVHAVNRFGSRPPSTASAISHGSSRTRSFSTASVRTLIWTVFVVGGTVLLSIPIALVLNENFYGRNIARVIIMLPWAVSLTMSGIVWRWSLNGQFGMVNATLSDLGLSSQPIEWLATATTAFPIEIAVGILVSIPFTVTVFLGGLSSLPADIYEAARIDGASGWQRCRLLTLPLLRPFINIVLVLNFIYVFNSFPLIWVMTQGDPANSTDILVTWLYKLAFRYGELGHRLGACRSSCSSSCSALPSPTRRSPCETRRRARGDMNRRLDKIDRPLGVSVAAPPHHPLSLRGDDLYRHQAAGRGPRLSAGVAAERDSAREFRRHVARDEFRSGAGQQPARQLGATRALPRSWRFRPPTRWRGWTSAGSDSSGSSFWSRRCCRRSCSSSASSD